MTNELALLNNYLLVGALLFAVGLIGFVSRRNMIVMFLSAEIMLQGVSLSLVAWSRFHNDFGGQMLVLFIIAVAACEAAVALALVLMLFHRTRQARHRPMAAGCARPTSRHFKRSRCPSAPSGRLEPLPHLAPAGVAPEIPREETDYRPRV